VDRVEKAARTSSADAIEAVRLGYIYARDHKQYRRWRSAADQADPNRKPDGLTGLALEQHIAGLHRSRPDLVAMRTA
jgi:hypothetical protein